MSFSFEDGGIRRDLGSLIDLFDKSINGLAGLDGNIFIFLNQIAI